MKRELTRLELNVFASKELTLKQQREKDEKTKTNNKKIKNKNEDKTE